MMNIETEAFKQKILELYASLESDVENGHKFSEISSEFISQFHKLLLGAAKSGNWDEIANEVAFFLYKGGTQGFLLHKLHDVFNKQCVPTINNATVKVQAQEQEIASLILDFENHVTNRASKAAQARHKNDPKQKAKKEVKQLWLSWQKNPELYKYKTKFALAMLDKYEGILTSQKVIADWCKTWEEEKK